MTNRMGQLNDKFEDINLKLLNLLNERAKLVKQVHGASEVQKREYLDPFKEQYMLDKMLKQNQGPFKADTIKQLFKDIFKADSALLEDNHNELRVSRKSQFKDTMIDIKNEKIGDGYCHYFMGPCAVESYEQVATVAKTLKKNGITILRGGAFKPRTSPYDFQGLGMDGLKILKKVADEYDLAVVSEIVNPSHMEMAANFLDIVQIGARNMQNFELLKAAGDIDQPILLKRGMTATIKEFIHAAEYIMSRGNKNVILCERGIRTFSQATRNTLDISSVPILKQETHLPVIVDVTHSTGRRDLLTPTAKAAVAVGADGIMAEVHPNPAIALSDSTQQMDIPMFENFMKELTSFSHSHT